jgi:hypothetical protein
LFAEWALFWVDRAEWRKKGNKQIDESLRGRDLRVSTPLDAPAQNRRRLRRPSGPFPS